jgi:hypothetical protein
MIKVGKKWCGVSLTILRYFVLEVIEKLLDFSPNCLMSVGVLATRVHRVFSYCLCLILLHNREFWLVT